MAPVGWVNRGSDTMVDTASTRLLRAVHGASLYRARESGSTPSDTLASGMLPDVCGAHPSNTMGGETHNNTSTHTTYLIMADTAPAAGGLAGGTLVEDVAVLLGVGVEGEWFAHQRGWHGHGKTLPCLAPVGGEVVVQTTGKDEGLWQSLAMHARYGPGTHVFVVEWMLYDHRRVALRYGLGA